MADNAFKTSTRLKPQTLQWRLLMTSCAILGLISPAMANPEDGLVASGSADIITSGNQLSVHQHSDRAVIDWRTFNIGKGETTTFYQNSSSSVALNRVRDANPSQILGTLNANGKVILINPNGVFFGKDSVIDVGGLVATTADIDNDKFMQGGQTLHFDKPGNPDSKIINEGRITAKEAGLVGLVAPNVSNSGVITAKMGRVSLASGDTFTADLYGDGLIEVAVSDQIKSQMIENTGKIEAAGGTIQIEAGAGRTMVNSLVTVSGELKAPAAVQRGGKIIIGAKGSNAIKGNVASDKGRKAGTSTVVVKAKIDASGYAAGQKGGTIEITGDKVTLAGGVRLDASGDIGGGDIRIGGDYQGTGTTPVSLETIIEKDAFVVNSAITQGDGGKTIVWSDRDADINGTFMNRGAAGGKGGFVETSGKKILNIGTDAAIDVGLGGEWLLDPEDIVISDTGNDGDAATSDIASSTINATLNSGGNVTITTNAGASGNGDITLSSANINKSSANNAATLMLRAYRNINMTSSTIGSSSGNALNVVLNADFDANQEGFISVTNSTINTSGGYFVAGGGSGALGGTNGILGDGDGTGADDVAAWGYGSNAIGVRFNNGDVSTGSGKIFVTGHGSDSTLSSANIGISSYNGSIIQASNGTISFKGTGGNGSSTSSNNYGVALGNSGTAVQTTGTGSIQIAGISGDSSGNSNQGIRIEGSSTVNAAGTGSIDLVGTGKGTGTSYGISINSASLSANGGAITATGLAASSTGTGGLQATNASITNSGAITLNGQARAGAGLTLTNGTVVSSGNALTLSGTGGSTGGTSGSNYGIAIGGTGTLVKTTGAQSLMMSGTAGSTSGNNNSGIRVDTSASIIATGSGSIELNGAGNGTGGLATGILASAATITGNGGLVKLAGTGGVNAAGSNNYGLQIFNGSTVSNSGNIILSGSGGGTNTSNSNSGVYIYGAGTSVNTTNSGNINVDGTGGTPPSSGGSNHGVYLEIANALKTTGSGSITINSVKGIQSSSFGFFSNVSDAVITTGTGNVTLLSDTISIANANTLNSAGVLTIAPKTAGATMAIGTTGSTLSLSNLYLDYLLGGSYVFGSATSGDVTVNTTKDFGDKNVTFKSGNDINLAGTLTKASGTGVANYVFEAARNIYNSSSAGISAASCMINLVFNADRDANQNGAIVLSSSNVTTNGGYAVFGGGSGALGGANGILGDGDGTGADDVAAWGNNTTVSSSTLNYGFKSINSTISTDSGKIFITGRGFAGSGNANYGVTLDTGSVTRTTSGSITIKGTGNGTGSSTASHGIYIAGSLQSVDGLITLNGTGGGGPSGTTNYGVHTAAGTSIQTTGAGNISIAGLGGSGSGGNNYGLNFATGTISSNSGTIQLNGTGSAENAIGQYGMFVAGSSITSNSGSILVNATAGGQTGSASRFGFRMSEGNINAGSGSLTITGTGGGTDNDYSVSGGTLGSGTTTGNITLIGDRMNITGFGAQTTGTMTLANRTAATTVGVGTGTGTLSLTNALLSQFTAGTYVLGSSTSGDITVNTTKDFADKNVTFKSGNDINLARTLTKASGNGVANYIFEAARNIYNSSAALAGINAISGMINLVFNADRDANQSGAINLTSGAITTNGGYAVFGGGSGALGGANGILGDGDGTGADDVAAWGNSLYNAGILFSDGDVATGAGKIILRGNGYNASLNNLYGVSLISGSILESTTGSIMVAGTGGNGNDLNYGVHISGSGAGIQSQKGAIKVSGTGGSNGTADSNDNIGVYIGATSKIESLGTASDASTITIDGQSPTNGDLGNNGVMIINATVTSKEGDIRINGTGRVRDFSRGVFFNGNAKVLSTGNAKIYLTGNSKSDIFSFSSGNEIGGASALGNIYMNADTVDLGGAMNVQTAGTVYVQPRTASTSIGLGGGTGTLNLTDAELAMFNAGALVIGDSALGTGDIDLDSWDLSGKTHSVEIYGNDIDIGGLTLGTGGFKAYAKNNGSDVGDLVISAAMTKSVSGSSLLDLRADNNIANSGYNITASTGSLNTILTSDFESNGAGTTQLGGTTVTSNGGAITIAKPLTLTGNTVLSAAGGNISLGTVDGAYNFTASGNTLDMTGALGGTTALNNVSLTSVNTMTLPSVRASTILARTTGANADLIVPVGKSITASGSGTAATLVAARNFLNQSATPLAMTGGGRWLVYSTDTTGTQLNGLSPSFVRYSCTYGGTCPAFASETGNGALYSFTPLLTVTPNALSTTYGEAAPSLSGYGYAASGYLSAWDQANIGLSGSLNGSTNYAQGSSAGAYNVNYTSGSLANALGYGFTYANRTGGLTVYQRVLTASLTGTVSKIYDGLTDAVLSAGNYVLSNVYNNETIGMTNASATYDTKDAGTGKNVSVTGLTLTGAGASNYTLSSTNASGAVGTIDKRGLSVNGIGIAGKTYNGNAVATITGTAGLSNTISGDNILLNVTGAAASFADANAGINKSVTVSSYSLNGADAGNYTLSQPTGLTATIAKKTLNAIADNITTTYGNSVPVGNISYHGFISGENASVLTAAPSVTSTQSGFADAGTYAGNYVVSGGSATNYEFNYIDGDLTVQKANLTITADNKFKTYGDMNPLLTAGFTGLVAGDTSSVVSGLNLSTAANQQSNAGTYTILASGGTASNYNITHANGTLTIGKADLTITADNKTKTYGDLNPALTASYSGLKSWDTTSVVSGLALSTAANQQSNAGTYTILASGGTASNYNITHANGTLTIGKADLTVTADNKAREYGALEPTFTASYTGLKSWDTSSSVSGLSFTTNAGQQSNVGLYDIVVSGGSSNNYNINRNNGSLNVTKANLTITADNKTKTYGDLNPALTASYSGLKSWDTTSVVSGLALSTTANQQSNAGTYTILASGGTANNYNVTHTDGIMTVGKANLTITADDKTKAYGAANPAFTASYSGLKSWDTPSVVTGLGLTSPAIMTSPAGNYAITPSGGTASNYNISYVNGNLMIGSGQIIITVTPQRRFQNADNPTFTVTYSGLLPGDTPDIITGLQLATTAAKNSQAGIYDIVASGAYAPNYSILYVNNKLTIDPLALPETVSMTLQDPTTASAMNGLSMSGASQTLSTSSSTQPSTGNSSDKNNVSESGKAEKGQSMQNRSFIGDLVEISPELAKILVMNDTVH